MTIHVVRGGETVTSIAAYYGTDPTRLAADNAVPSSGALAVGQTLVVRFPRQVHSVRSGETLSSIARDYGVSVRRLWRNNWSLGGEASLTPGQTLVISYLDEKLGTTLSNGYAYPFIEPELLNEQLPYLTYLAPFTYGITASGDLLPLNDDALLAAARQRGTRPVMHLSTLTESGQFDTQRGELVLTDSAVQDQLISQVMQTVLRRGYAGVDVDFEYLPGPMAAAYAEFLGRLQRLLQSQGLFLWTALAPKTSAGQRGLLYEGHDYAAVGSVSDGVLLMTYGYGLLAHRLKPLENQGIIETISVQFAIPNQIKTDKLYNIRPKKPRSRDRGFFISKEDTIMSNSNYFHGGEAGQFSFFRIPRALMKDARFHDLSTDAKLLYGLMLDRMGLSLQSGWLDGQNRVFIYFTLEEIQDTIVCGHNKAVRLLAELEKYALIERVKQGQGKPAKIYVKNFVSADGDAGEAAPENPQSAKVKTWENPTSTLPLLKPLDCPKGEGIYTDKNYTEFSYINPSINPQGQPPTSGQVERTPPCLQDITACQHAPFFQQDAPLPHSDAAGGAVRASMSSVKQTTLVGGKAPKPPDCVSWDAIPTQQEKRWQ